MKSLPPEIVEKARKLGAKYRGGGSLESEMSHLSDGIHWGFAEAIEYVRAEVERRIAYHEKRINTLTVDTIYDEAKEIALSHLKNWLSELQNKGDVG